MKVIVKSLLNFVDRFSEAKLKGPTAPVRLPRKDEQYHCFKDDELIGTFHQVQRADEFMSRMTRNRVGHFEIIDEKNRVIYERINRGIGTNLSPNPFAY